MCPGSAPSSISGPRTGSSSRRSTTTAIAWNNSSRPSRLRAARWSAALIAALFALQAPFAGAQEANPEFLLPVQPGDTLIGLSERYLQVPADWPKIRRLNNVANPRRLVPGSTLRIPVDMLKPEAERAEVMVVSGSATVADQPLVAGNRVAAGAVIRTGADGFVSLRTPDGSVISLQPATEAQVQSVSRYRSTDIFRTVVRMVTGRIEALVEKVRGPSRFEVQTEVAVAGVRGTRFRVAAERGPGAARSQTEVIEGSVGFRAAAAGEAVVVDAGFGSVTDASGRPQAPAALLGAPDIRTDDALQERIVTRFRFPAVAGATRYRGQVALDRDFRRGISEAQFTTPEIKFADLPDGEYFLRARAVDAVGLEGRDAVFGFRLKARPEPPLLTAPGPAGKLRAVRASLSWTANPDARGYRVQVSEDESFARIVEERALDGTEMETRDLPFGEYFWRVRSIRGSESAPDPGPWGDARKFNLRPPPKTPAPPEEGSNGLNFAWEGEPGQSFLFQLAADPGFARLLAEHRLATPRLILPYPEQGVYYVRIQATDGDGFVGPFTAPQRFEFIRRIVDGSGRSLSTGDGKPVRLQ